MAIFRMDELTLRSIYDRTGIQAKKQVHIDMLDLDLRLLERSSANLRLEPYGVKEFSLIPGNLSAMEELTRIFQPDKFDITFTQMIYLKGNRGQDHNNPDVCITIMNKQALQHYSISDYALSPEEYTYITGLFLSVLPLDRIHPWLSVEEYIRRSIRDDLISKDIFDILPGDAVAKLVSLLLQEHQASMQRDGLVDVSKEKLSSVLYGMMGRGVDLLEKYPDHG